MSTLHRISETPKKTKTSKPSELIEIEPTPKNKTESVKEMTESKKVENLKEIDESEEDNKIVKGRKRKYNSDEERKIARRLQQREYRQRKAKELETLRKLYNKQQKEEKKQQKVVEKEKIEEEDSIEEILKEDEN